ncbi:hypothetical protein HDU89_007673 [Geranomyces variabilis]|nr:hypothetical protein HDU89_007673 [Geranomyces variabilis]
MSLGSQVWEPGYLGDRTGYLTKRVLPLPNPTLAAATGISVYDTETGELGPRTTLGIKINELQDNPAFAELVRTAGVGPNEERFHAIYGDYLAALIDIRLAVAGALAGAPCQQTSGPRWRALVYQSDVRSRREAGSRVQTCGALFAVCFFGDLTEENGSDAVINAAIDEVESLCKSFNQNVSSPAERRAAEQLMSYGESWLKESDQGTEGKGHPAAALKEAEALQAEGREAGPEAPRCGVRDEQCAVSVCITCLKPLCTTATLLMSAADVGKRKAKRKGGKEAEDMEDLSDEDEDDDQDFRPDDLNGEDDVPAGDDEQHDDERRSHRI